MNKFEYTVQSTLHRYTGDCTWYSHQVPAAKQLWVHIDPPPAACPYQSAALHVVHSV